MRAALLSYRAESKEDGFYGRTWAWTDWQSEGRGQRKTCSTSVKKTGSSVTNINHRSNITRSVTSKSFFFYINYIVSYFVFFSDFIYWHLFAHSNTDWILLVAALLVNIRSTGLTILPFRYFLGSLSFWTCSSQDNSYQLSYS